jgi:5-methyltetrahydropteroyltriglutamate--homocysteine methyltransferase
MATMTSGTSAPQPFFRADHVGSLLRPKALHEARRRHEHGEIGREALRAAEDAAIVEAIRMQEDAGLPVVTDGEFRRVNWWRDFVERMPGVRVNGPDLSGAFHKPGEEAKAYLPKIVETVGAVSHRGALMARDWTFIKSRTRAVPKMTIPAPSRIHFHGGRDAIDRAAYPDLAAFWADIVAFYRAEVASLEALGCRYIQLDDPVIAYLIDERMRAKLSARGEDPDETVRTYVRVLNEITAARRPETLIAYHICRGNAGGAFGSAGGYGAIAELIFPVLKVDSYLLEYDSERAGDFVPLTLMPKGQRVVLGLVTTKHGALESKDALKRRLDEAARHVSLERCAVSPQCGFASIVEGNPLEHEQQAAKLRLVVELAREVWGRV